MRKFVITCTDGKEYFLNTTRWLESLLLEIEHEDSLSVINNLDCKATIFTKHIVSVMEEK